jgi:type IV pilus assembly protein PilF
LDRLGFIAVLFLTCFLSSCATTDTVQDSQSAGAHYKIGVAYLNDNRVQQAFLEFQKAYEFNPRDKEVLHAIGLVYLMHFDDTQKAIEYFEKALRVDPNYSEANNSLGVAQDKLGNFETAITYYKKAVSNLLYSTPDKPYINMGNSYYRLGRYDEALYVYKEAIKRAPDLSLPYLRMALCYNKMGRYGDAALAMTQALKLDSFFKGDREKAFESFNNRKLKVSGYEEKDINDYLDILRY